MMTGTYQINNNTLPSPTTGKWINPSIRGDNGDGQKRWDRFYSYEITWNYLDYSEFNGLMRVWRGHYNSGNAVANLPLHENTQWYFGEFSGTKMDQPEYGKFYNTYYQDVKLLIRKIAIT